MERPVRCRLELWCILGIDHHVHVKRAAEKNTDGVDARTTLRFTDYLF
jgi:hypothetical protein